MDALLLHLSIDASNQLTIVTQDMARAWFSSEEGGSIIQLLNVIIMCPLGSGCC